MVKANAYGVGAIPVVNALAAVNPWGFGVATVEEGAELRHAGVEGPILVFTPALVSDREQYREHDLRAVLDDPDSAAGWDAPYHLEIDTGMGRAGISWTDAARIERAVTPFLEGVFTHFHSADESESSVREQLERFRVCVTSLERRPPLVHACNSAGVFRLHGEFDLVRPGIFLYGGDIGPELPGPEPVVSVRARVVSVRDLAPGATVSYGAEWTTHRPTSVATLGIGYADGIPRAIRPRGSVLLHGQRCPIVGRVTMDMLMVDVGALAPHRVVRGDVATLIGEDGSGRISLGEFAGWAGTISYEILVGLGSRLSRRYGGA
jgi:alanine racemase